jgi:succinate dehydrogenase hydrophobic anchor subunit
MVGGMRRSFRGSHPKLSQRAAGAPAILLFTFLPSPSAVMIATAAGGCRRLESVMSAQVFISHASKDQKVARTICSALEGRGLKCWIASRDIGPGENFMEAIVRAIRACKVMVLVFSSAANNSDEIKREIVLAGQNKLVVIPVRVEDVAPSDAFAYQFATRQWIDLFDDWEHQIERLTSWIGAILQVAPAALGSVSPGAPASQPSAVSPNVATAISQLEPTGTNTVKPVMSDAGILAATVNHDIGSKSSAAHVQKSLSRVPPARPWWINITAPTTYVGTVLITWLLTAVSLGPKEFVSAAWLVRGIAGLAILVWYALALCAQSLNSARRVIYIRRLVSAPSVSQHFWYEDLTAFATVPLTIVMAVIVGTIFNRNHAAIVQIIGAPLVTVPVLLFIICAATQTLVHVNNIIDEFFQKFGRYVAKLSNGLFMIALVITAVYALFRINFII